MVKFTPSGFQIQNIASLLVMLMVTISIPSCTAPEEEYATTVPGEKRDVDLPDGSNVTLNAVSKLGWSPSKWAQGRYVTLEGEAYFQTKKGKRFTVKTKFGNVEVLGTIFNVYARDGLLEVQCLDGKVQVINPKGKQKVMLKKGEEVAVNGGWMQSRQRLRFYPVWYKGESSFRDAPVERVLGEIERQYGVLVLADSLEGLSFSGKIGHKDIEKALVAVLRPVRLTYAIRGDTVHIAHRPE